MLDVKRLIEDLENLREHPHLYIQPVTPEALFNYLISVARGVMLTTDPLTSGDFIDARRHASLDCGWQSRATGPHVEMREKGMSDEEIIEEQIKVEVRMWRILRRWQEEHLKANE